MNKFIHQTAVVYLALIVLIRMMSMPLSLLDYSLNQRFIEQHLCENRSNAIMHCAGKCYLNKQLARSGDAQDSRDQKSNVKVLIIDFFEPLNRPSFSKTEVSANYNAQFLTLAITSPYTAGIFHPPIA